MFLKRLFGLDRYFIIFFKDGVVAVEVKGGRFFCLNEVSDEVGLSCTDFTGYKELIYKSDFNDFIR